MKQELVLKKKVTLKTPKTLKAVLKEAMLEKGIELSLMSKVAEHLIFNVEGELVRNLSTEIKAGQTVRLIPAVKAG